MFIKIKAWLDARLHLRYNLTIPGTRIIGCILIHRITGRYKLDWFVPDYILHAEHQCMANPTRETQVQVIVQVTPNTDVARRLKARWN